MAGSIDTITDKNQICIDVDVLGLRAGKGDEIISELKRLGGSLAADAKLSPGISLHAHQRNRLPETSLLARTPKAERFELLSNIKRRQLAAAGAGAAALEPIIGKEFNVGAECILANRARQRAGSPHALRQDG